MLSLSYFCATTHPSSFDIIPATGSGNTSTFPSTIIATPPLCFITSLTTAARELSSTPTAIMLCESCPTHDAMAPLLRPKFFIKLTAGCDSRYLSTTVIFNMSLSVSDTTKPFSVFASRCSSFVISCPSIASITLIFPPLCLMAKSSGFLKSILKLFTALASTDGIRVLPFSETFIPSTYVAMFLNSFKLLTTIKSAGSPIFNVPTSSP